MPPKKRGKGNPHAKGRPKTVDKEALGHDGRNAYHRERARARERAKQNDDRWRLVPTAGDRYIGGESIATMDQLDIF
jgi:hypothetical protein